MINILIVEDEIPAQIRLKKLIDKCCPNSQIVTTLTSVKSTIKWLEENPDGADVIFMDVELADGVCFEIFDKVAVSAHVIITTAYDNYAINAFKINSVDYLLKPIGEEELKRAWERSVERLEARHELNIEALLDIVSQARKGSNRSSRNDLSSRRARRLSSSPWMKSPTASRRIRARTPYVAMGCADCSTTRSTRCRRCLTRASSIAYRAAT